MFHLHALCVGRVGIPQKIFITSHLQLVSITQPSFNFHHSMEVPVLWLRVDPEFQWLRQLVVEQPDTIWHNILKYERDAVAQVEVSELSSSYM